MFNLLETKDAVKFHRLTALCLSCAWSKFFVQW